jgi:hypothetical protein
MMLYRSGLILDRRKLFRSLFIDRNNFYNSKLNYYQLAFKPKSYNGFYLAVAERKGGEQWTAIERLCNRAQQLGLSWVRWIEEE